jgi:TonB-dependent starch-binding outer membrane protein SusC
MKFNHLRQKLLLLSIIFSISITFSQNQSREINGVISDETSQPIIGASVYVKGNAGKGTISDANGKFQLKLNGKENSLIVSYLGYLTQEVSITGSDTYNVILKEDQKELDEIVVLGYGTVRKKDLSGSVSVLEMKDNATEQPTTNLAQFLQGRVAGVQIQQNSGAPGSGITIQIRGQSTITGSTDPLYVVDGVPQDDISMINPNDVESMQVLKDASATAIYGSRGTNGVILITTKEGKKGGLEISYNFRTDISNISKFYNVLNAYEYGLYQNEVDRTIYGFDALGNALPGNLPRNTPEQLELNKIYSTDWQRLIYQTGITTSNQLTLSGGKEGATFSLSGFYDDQKGIILNSAMKRYGYRLNYVWDVSPKLKITSRLNFTQNNTNIISNSDPSSGQTIVHNTLLTKPTIMPTDVYDESGELFAGEMPRDNPYRMVNDINDIMEKQQFGANFGLSYDISKALNFKVNTSLNTNDVSSKTYYPLGTFDGNNANGAGIISNIKNDNYLIESTLNYNKRFNKNNRLNFVAGWTYEYGIRESLNLEVNNFPNDDLGFYGLSYGLSTPNVGNGYRNKILSSYLSRANYTLMDKYIFTATGRYDGSALLAKGHQWAFFPSGAFAWRISEENFMKNQEFITNLKFKTSIGITGSQSIGYGAPLALMGINTYPINGTTQHGAVPSSLANPDLTWEKTTQSNIGFELGMVKNKIRLNVDAYNRITNGLLIDFKLPSSAGYGVMPLNIGSIRNRGIEIEANADILTGEIKWSIGGNITFDQNKVLDLNESTMDGRSYLAGGGALNQPINRTMEGYPVGSFYGYVIDGLYQTADEVANAPIDPNCIPTLGSLKFLDISGPDGLPDGVINTSDMTILGHYQPDFVYGISSDFTWKNLSVNILIQGSEGGKVANLNRYKLDAFTLGDNVSKEAWEGRWTGPGTSNYYPVVDGSKVSAMFGSRFSNFVLEDASFMRLKNVTLSYSIPSTKMLGIKYIKLFVTGSNLFTLTKYKGYDPEISIPGSPLNGGVDYAVFPMSKTFSIGANVAF